MRSATTRLSSWSSKLTLESGTSGHCKTSMALKHSEVISQKQRLEIILLLTRIVDCSHLDCASKIHIYPIRYFSVQPGGGVQAGEAKRPEEAPLQLVWQDDGTVAMKAESGKFVGAKKSGNHH